MSTLFTAVSTLFTVMSTLFTVLGKKWHKIPDGEAHDQQLCTKILGGSIILKIIPHLMRIFSLSRKELTALISNKTIVLTKGYETVIPLNDRTQIIVDVDSYGSTDLYFKKFSNNQVGNFDKETSLVRCFFGSVMDMTEIRYPNGYFPYVPKNDLTLAIGLRNLGHKRVKVKDLITNTQSVRSGKSLGNEIIRELIR